MTLYRTDLAKGTKTALNASQSEALPQRIEFVNSVALAINDIIEMGPLLEDHVIVDLILDSDDLDTNGAPAITLSVGILNAAKTDLDTVASGGALWIVASTVAQAGGAVRPTTLHAFRLQAMSALRRLIGIKVVAAAATTVAALTNLNVNRGLWMPNTAYTANDFFTLPNGVRQKCTTTGVSGAVKPQFNAAYNNTTADGTAVWTTADPVIGLTVVTRSANFGS
ncbi:MAG: hypothetical protein AABM33_05915 [Pseudomonadota bacterium]